MTKSTCIGPECNRPVRCKKVCNTHYNQMLAGKPLTVIIKQGLPIEQRVWANVDKSGECWEWTAGKVAGYGILSVGRTPRRAHGLAYELVVGPIPEGAFLDHICRNRGCVNPKHLRPVNHKQNSENLDPMSPRTNQYRGVNWHKGTGKWMGRTTHHGERIQCGYYDTPEEAYEAVRAKRNELHTHNNLDRF